MNADSVAKGDHRAEMSKHFRFTVQIDHLFAPRKFHYSAIPSPILAPYPVLSV